MRTSTLLLWLMTLLAALFTTVPTLAAQCDGPANPATGETWQGWGNGYGNNRHVADGLGSADLPTMQLKWAFGFPGVSSVVGNPVVHGNVIYIGVDSGEVYALDIDSACVYWTFKADAGVRTAPALAQVTGNTLLFFGDRNANVTPFPPPPVRWCGKPKSTATPPPSSPARRSSCNWTVSTILRV